MLSHATREGQDATADEHRDLCQQRAAPPMTTRSKVHVEELLTRFTRP